VSLHPGRAPGRVFTMAHSAAVSSARPICSP
jgi:hypothetical protein